MLQGFNHNVRYRERTFHVQTEDSGLSLPRVVTQLFLDGQILAHEKTTYEHILAQNLPAEARDSAIRDVMQHQHKGLMRNLVRGTYDSLIATHVDATPDVTSAPSGGSQEPTTAPVEVVYSTSAPVNEPASQRATDGADTTTLNDPDAPDPLAASGPRTSRPRSDEAPPLGAAASRSRDFASAVAGLEEAEPAPHSHSQPFFSGEAATEARHLSGVAFDSAARPTGRGDTRGATSRTDQRPRFGGSLELEFDEEPPVPRARRTSGMGEEATPDLDGAGTDTLVDFGLPASLRERLKRSLSAIREGGPEAAERPSGATLSHASDGGARSPERQSPNRTQPHEAAPGSSAGEARPAARLAEGQGGRPFDSDSTLIDVTSADVRWRMAQDPRRRPDPVGAPHGQRAEAGQNHHTRARRPRDESRPSILVVERSLDEVILSYLADDE